MYSAVWFLLWGKHVTFEFNMEDRHIFYSRKEKGKKTVMAWHGIAGSAPDNHFLLPFTHPIHVTLR